MDRHRGRRGIWALAVAVAALSAAPAPARAAVANVDEVGTSFKPAEIPVRVNDRVVWTNQSAQSHTVTFTGGPDLHPSCDPLLRLGCQAPGTTVERTFTTAGRFTYHCKIHSGMQGAVIVAGTSTTSSTTSSTVAKSSSSTTTTTQKATSSTTATTRPLSTSSTVMKSSTTTTSEATSVLLPGEPPTFSDGGSPSAASRPGDSTGSGSGPVALIVGLLLAVSAGGGYLLWRLRPGRP